MMNKVVYIKMIIGRRKKSLILPDATLAPFKAARPSSKTLFSLQLCFVLVSWFSSSLNVSRQKYIRC